MKPIPKKYIIISKLLQYVRLKDSYDEIIKIFKNAIKPDEFEPYVYNGTMDIAHILELARFVLKNFYMQYDELIEVLKNEIMDLCETDKQKSMAERFFKKIGAVEKIRKKRTKPESKV